MAKEQVKDYSDYSNGKLIREIGKLEKDLKSKKSNLRWALFSSLLATGMVYYTAYMAGEISKTGIEGAKEISATCVENTQNLVDKCNQTISNMTSQCEDIVAKRDSDYSSLQDKYIVLANDHIDLSGNFKDLSGKYFGVVDNYEVAVNNFSDAVQDKKEILEECNSALSTKDSLIDESFDQIDVLVSLVEIKNSEIYSLEQTVGDIIFPKKDSLEQQTSEQKGGFYQKVKSFFGIGKKK